MSSNEQEINSEIRSVCEKIKSSKNTALLYHLQNVIEKCFNGKQKISNRDSIRECLNQIKNLYSSRLFENLLKKAIETNDAELCSAFIKNTQILEENQAVDCLKFFLKDLNENEFGEDVKKQIKRNRNLDLLFSKSYDKNILTGEVKKLSSKEFIICLQYLLNDLKAYFDSKSDSKNSSVVEESEIIVDEDKDDDDDDVIMIEDNDVILIEQNGEKSESLPSILQVIDLFCCFVDAHFTHVTLSSKAQEIIADALLLIEAQLDLFVDIVNIESLIKEAKQNKLFKMKNNENIGHYYIEVLKLA